MVSIDRSEAELFRLQFLVLGHSALPTLSTWMGGSQWFVVSSRRRFRSRAKAFWSGKCLRGTATDDAIVPAEYT
jgi:hypothetical protein